MEWPVLKDEIDDPDYYSDEYEWIKDDGACYPKRKYPYDYHHH
jgi:hypothetical protein